MKYSCRRDQLHGMEMEDEKLTDWCEISGRMTKVLPSIVRIPKAWLRDSRP